MIPSRDEIERWIVSMRDEIDRLTRENDELQRSVDDTDGKIAAMEIHGNSAEHWYLKATAYKDAYSVRDEAIAEATKLRADLDRANTEAALARDALAKATTERDATANHRDDLIALCRTWEAKLVAAGIKRQTTVSDGIAELIRQRDEFRSLTRPPKMEARIESLMEDMLRESIDNPGDDPADLVAIEERIGTADERFVVLRQDISEMANLQSALAKATTPAPEREASIRAWEEDATLHRCGSRFDDDDPRATYLMARSEITAAVALMRSAGDGKALLRELREDLEVYPDGIWTTREMVAKIGLLLARPAPVEQPAATASRFDERASELRAMLSWVEYQPCLRNTIAGEEVRSYLTAKIKELDEQAGAPVEKPAADVPDHFPDAGKMVPVLYWLEDGKFARAMLVGKDLLVVDLTFGDGPSVVGKPEWFDAGYVAAYGGLVPESATRGKEPGQWDYGVASIAKPAAAVPDPANEHMQCGQCGYFMTKGSICTKCGWIDKPAAAVPDDTRWQLVAQLGHFVCMMLKGEANRAEVRAIISKLRGGA